jgi:hypothetical protein
MFISVLCHNQLFLILLQRLCFHDPQALIHLKYGICHFVSPVLLLCFWHPGGCIAEH